MTSRFRLLFMACASLLALLAGLFTGAIRTQEAPEGRRIGLSTPQLANAEDIDRYVEAIYRSNLFPDAQLRSDAPANPGEAQTLEELQESLSDPSLSALVKWEDVWRIYLYDADGGIRMHHIGDQLADGWLIQNIDSTSVLLTKGEQSRRIEVFKAEPDTQ